MVSQTSRFFVVACCFCVASNPVFAAKAKAKQPVKVNEGVVLYNKGEYAAALPILLKTIKASPADPLYHYYLGLCYDRLHSGASAKGQFVWVAKNSKDKRLRSYAETALHGNSSVVSTGSSPAAEPATEPAIATDNSNNNTSAGSGASSDANYGVSSRLPYGRCKIYFFESANKESQQFAPIFDAAARSYRGSFNFQRLDVSDPATVTLLQKYKVTTFPHLIYLDGKDIEIYNEGPRTFNTRLTELLGK
ncbi:MAG: hypothetical protein P4L53_25960 [Candidatus Obscuribacterales bacterium]|nr:hypothetical protein [Candidatus Obscuribacterales bacterium]